MWAPGDRKRIKSSKIGSCIIQAQCFITETSTISWCFSHFLPIGCGLCVNHEFRAFFFFYMHLFATHIPNNVDALPSNSCTVCIGGFQGCILYMTLSQILLNASHTRKENLVAHSLHQISLQKKRQFVGFTTLHFDQLHKDCARMWKKKERNN